MFFPETYTNNECFPVSSFFVSSFHEVNCTRESRTNLYRISYLMAPRQWCWLNVLITIHRSSSYWAFTQLTPEEWRIRDTSHVGAWASLPPLLSKQVQRLLPKPNDFGEDAAVRFYSEGQDLRRTHMAKSLAPSLALAAGTSEHLEALAFLNDLGCPRYFESELSQIAVIEPPYWFATWVRGSVACEIRFSLSVSSPDLPYEIQLLCCMKGHPRFAKFIGIVTNAAGTQLKGYLFEPPRTNVRGLVMGERREIPWQRREKLARQIIKAVRHVHSEGLVVGSLAASCRKSTAIDSFDQVRLLRFKRKLILGHTLNCYDPPEFYHLRYESKSTREAEAPDLTPKTDIFQLGLVLWFLAEGIRPERRSPFCIRKRCLQFRDRCRESHRDPVALPALRPDVPQYYKDIVKMCRAEDPYTRPTAWRLLELFPSQEHNDCKGKENPLRERMDIGSVFDFNLGSASCDHCGCSINASLFHCNICSVGDWDVCLRCYESGLHYKEPGHWMVEVERLQAQYYKSSGRHHSNRKDSGTREIVEL